MKALGFDFNPVPIINYWVNKLITRPSPVIFSVHSKKLHPSSEIEVDVFLRQNLITFDRARSLVVSDATFST
jgi:hypothetical protein